VAEASPVLPSPEPTPAATEQGIEVDPIIGRAKPPEHQYLDMALTLSGQEYTNPMSQIRPDFFRGLYRIRLPLPPTADLALRSTLSTFSHDTVVPVGRWTIPLIAGDADSSDPGVVLTAAQEPKPPDTSDALAGRILTNGFRLTARLRTHPDEAVLTIELALLPATYPVEAYYVTTEVQGEDVRIDFRQQQPGLLTAATIVPRLLRNRKVTFTLMAVPTLRADGVPYRVAALPIYVSNPDHFEPHVSFILAGSNPGRIGPTTIDGAGYKLTEATRMEGGQRLIDFTLAINPSGAPATR
jgi:hypothetical protein